MDPLALRQMVSHVCSNELPKKLEALLDRYDKKGFILRLDQLRVNVSIQENEQLTERLADAIIAELEKALRRAVDNQAVDAVPEEKNLLQTLLFYLKEGFLPWWSQEKEAGTFRQSLREIREPAVWQHYFSELLPALKDQPALRRFLALSDRKVLWTFLQSAALFDVPGWEVLASWPARFDVLNEKPVSKAQFEELLFQAIFTAIIKGYKKEEAFRSVAAFLAEKLPETNEQIIAQLLLSDVQKIKPITAQPVNEPSEKKWPDQEKHQPVAAAPVFIQNAGLIILAPFLTTFFKQLGLVENGVLTDTSRAVSLLHYLAFGTKEFEEWEVPLEKLLCGLPLRESPQPAQPLTDTEKEEAHNLLVSAIEHWQALKTTSPDGLRHSFLQREGKLLFKGDMWQLTIQKQAHDILLDYLPWSISMIKLPWMPHLIFTNWDAANTL